MSTSLQILVVKSNRKWIFPNKCIAVLGKFLLYLFGMKHLENLSLNRLSSCHGCCVLPIFCWSRLVHVLKSRIITNICCIHLDSYSLVKNLKDYEEA